MFSNEQKALVILFVISIVIGAYAYAILPSQMVTHWNAQGKPNGYLSKEHGVFIMPLVLAFISALCFVIPKIDPFKANLEGFRVQYERFFIVVAVVMLLVQIQSILWNLGTMIDFSITMPILLGLLFIYLGFFLEKSKRNWFMGIRTPWTMSNDKVWERTHQVGCKIFVVAGILSILSAFFPVIGILPVIGFILLGSLFLIVYSYWVYREEENSKDSKKR